MKYFTLFIILTLFPITTQAQFLKNLKNKAEYLINNTNDASIVDTSNDKPIKVIPQKEEPATEVSQNKVLKTTPEAHTNEATPSEIEFMEFKNPSNNLKTISLPAVNNTILITDIRYARNQLNIQEALQNYKRYIDLYLLKHFKPFIEQIDRKHISSNSQNLDDRKKESWKSSVFAQQFVLKSATKHLSEPLSVQYFCDASKKDCVPGTANYLHGGTWGGDSKNKFRELELYGKYMNSGILEETQNWADAIFNNDSQTYYLVKPMAIQDTDYDFKNNSLSIFLNISTKHLEPIWLLPEIETEGFSLNFPTQIHFMHQLEVRMVMNPDEAEQFFKEHIEENARSVGGKDILCYAVYKIKLVYKETVQDLSKSHYSPMVRAQLKIVSPMVTLYKDPFMNEKITELNITTAKIK